MKNPKGLWDKLTFQNVLFVVFAIALAVLLYMRDITGVDTNKFLLLAFVVGYALIADYEHLMMLIAFILPLTNGLPSNYILPIICLLIVIKGGRQMKVPSIVWVSFLAISLYELIHVFMFAHSFEAPAYVGYCSFLFLILVIGGSFDSRSNESKNALAFCLGTVVMLIIILMNFSQLVGDYFFEGSVRMGNVSDYLGEGVMTLRTNPNNIGLFSIAAISIVFALWYYKKIPVCALALVAVPAFVCGVYSLSRTWMLSIILFALLFFVMRKGKNRGSSFIILLIAVVGVFYFFTRLNVSVLESFDTRFSGDTDTAGSRTTLFLTYHKWMFENTWALLFGTGAIPYREVTQIENSTHNAIQQVFISYGIPGLLFFIYLLVRLIKNWRVRGERMVYVPILTIGFFLQSSQFLNPAYCAFPFIASFFVLKMVKKDEMYSITRKTS